MDDSEVKSYDQAPAPAPTPGPTKKKPEDYRFGKLLGEGSFSSVYLAKDVKTGNECAIKVCAKLLIIKERKAELIKREKEVMTILSANKNPKIPFFVKLHATFQDAERLYFVMTYARGGELLKYISRPRKTDTSAHFFDLNCCRFYVGEIVVALAHLHSLNIVHRDLKPENILLDERGHILITDFGSAKILRDVKDEESQNDASAQSKEAEAESPVLRRPKRNNSFVGTAQYVSPEVLQGHYSEVGPAADLWALGCIVYQCVYGVTPFQAGTEYLIFQKIMKLGYQFPEDVDSDVRSLVEGLIKLDPMERLGIQDTERYTSLNSHPFFNGEDIHAFCEKSPTPLFKYLTSRDEVELGAGESIHTHSYSVPDSLAPGFNPRIIAQRALQDDGVPFSTPNVESNSKEIVNENHMKTTVKAEPGQLINESNQISKDKDDFLNNSKNNNDPSSNSGCGAGCNCVLI